MPQLPALELDLAVPGLALVASDDCPSFPLRQLPPVLLSPLPVEIVWPSAAAISKGQPCGLLGAAWGAGGGSSWYVCCGGLEGLENCRIFNVGDPLDVDAPVAGWLGGDKPNDPLTDCPVPPVGSGLEVQANVGIFADREQLNAIGRLSIAGMH